MRKGKCSINKVLKNLQPVFFLFIGKPQISHILLKDILSFGMLNENSAAPITTIESKDFALPNGIALTSIYVHLKSNKILP